MLSHDQVEAVLMRRAGYEVRVLPLEDGSWEENPPTLLEFARRDLRWCQGNLQYARLLGLPGLRPISRCQLALAMLMFVGSPAWLAMIVLATFRDLLVDASAPTFRPEVVADGDAVRVGDLDLRFSRTDHPVETLAVRADSDGRSIAYSADTGPAWSLAALGTGFDLAVVEATLDEDEARRVQHLTGRQAGRLAADAGARALLLTHLAPGTDPARRAAEAAEAYDGPVEVAEIHRTYVAGGTPQP